MYNDRSNNHPISTITLQSDRQVKLEQVEHELHIKFLLVASTVKDLTLIRELHLYPPNLTFDEYSRAKRGFPETFVNDLASAVDVVLDIGETATPTL
jgi:hypothetical protein